MSANSAQGDVNGQECSGPSLVELLSHLLSEGTLLRIGQGEKLYKLYFFRPAWGRQAHFEHCVLTKQRTDGMLEMISYTCWVAPEGHLERSNILRVPEMPIQALERIITQILTQTHTSPGEFEEVDLTDFNTLGEQLDHLREYIKSPS